jgi:hypothetical protein
MTRFPLAVCAKPAVCAAAIALGCLVTVPAQAAIQTYDITIDVTAGSLEGNRFTGRICYDDEFLTGMGIETVTPYLGLSTRINFLGQTYDQTDDTDYPEFPQLILQEGEIQRLEFWVESDQRGSWWETPGWTIELTRQAPGDLPGCGPAGDSIMVQ